MRTLRRRTSIAAALVLCAARTAPAQDSIQARPLADGVWLVTGAIDNIGVLSSSEGTLLIDAGYVETANGVAAALRTIDVPRPHTIVNTHWHHAFANTAFQPARVVAHESLRAVLARDNPMFDRLVPAFPDDALPDLTFESRLTLDWGGIRLELIHYPASHSAGDVVVWIPSRNLLFSGDLAVPHVPWIDRAAGGSIDGLIAAVDDLLGWLPRDARIVPGHDTIMSYDGLAAYQALLGAARDRVSRGIVLGRSRQQIVSGGIGPEWRGWATIIADSVLLGNIYDDLLESGLARAPRSLDCEFRNGLWYADTGFVRGAWHVRDGRLHPLGQEPPDCVVDLEGAYVVPAYGDAHKHDLNGMGSVSQQNRTYLDAGVFYVMEQDPIIAVPDSVRSFVARPGTVDVVYHEGVVAPSWNFITDYYRRLAAGGTFGPGATLASIDGHRIFVIDDLADLDRKWSALARQNPDFIKVILAYSDEHERRLADTATYRGTARPGLDPALLPELVRQAHSAGLRVSVHPENRADFRAAVESGADIVAHLPASWQIGEVAGYAAGELDPYLLTDDDARRAAELSTIVITTAQPLGANPDEGFRTIHTHNLALLRDHGVRVVLGSDGTAATANHDIFYIDGLGVYDRAELFRMLVRETPAAIFPSRRIGDFGEGAEASFLVLEGNPLEDLQHLRAISFGVKQGEVVTGRLPTTTR